MTGTEVHLVLSSNWGDPSYIGLTGITLLETGSQEPVVLKPDQVNLLPESAKGEDDLTDAGGLLVDGVNLTTDAAHMWVCPLPCPAPLDDSYAPTLVIRLDQPRSLRGLRVWNYNASLEDTYKGVRSFIACLPLST